MLIVRASWSGLVIAFFVGIFAVIGFFVFHPVYINVCEGGQRGTAQKCEPHNVLYIALSNILDTMTHAEFWTAVATIFIAAFTYTLKRSTDKLWGAGEKQFRLAKETADRQAVDIQNQIDIAKKAAEHIPRTERAYIYGGIGIRYLIGCDDLDVLLGVKFTMANYGKTPGFITYIEVGTGDLRTINPNTPIYDPDTFNISDLFFPEMKLKDVIGTEAHVSVPQYGRPVVFQRVHYKDIFGKEHFSGSIYEMFIVQHRGRYAVGGRPVLPGSPYWDWDKEPEG